MSKRAVCLLAAVLLAACGSEPAEPAGLDAGRRDAGPGRDAEVLEFEDAGRDAGRTPAIDWCNLQAPHSAGLKPGGQLAVYGQVFSDGLTNGAGAGAGIAGQVGHGPAGSDPRTSSAWTWSAATFNTDLGQNDEYQGTIAPAQAGDYAFAFRFSLNGGAQVYCDTDGNNGSASGFDPAKLGVLAVKEGGIEWCNLQSPPNATITAGASLVAYGQVFVSGATEGEGAGSGIEGQLGHGPLGTDGSSGAGWTWTDAVFNKDEGNNDEYQASISPAVGAWAYGYRFRLDGGAWTYCDLDGSANGYGAAQQGSLKVNEVKPAAVEWCNLQAPATASVRLGESAEIYGRVLATGVTDAAGQGPGIVGQIGYGPVGRDPRVSEGWSWSAATFNVDDGPNDEYLGRVAPQAPGSYAYAFRFRLGDAPPVYCDLDGNDGGAGGFALDKLGALEVKAPAVEWCNVQFPASASLTTGDTLTAFGQVYVIGATEAAGQGAGIEGQLGYGAAGTDGSTSAAWTWVDATYHKDDGNHDEYQAELSPAAGSYAYAYRFRLQGGSWLYCDVDGSHTGYDVAQQGALEVADVKPAAVDWCALQFPPDATIVAGGKATVFGQVYVAGATEAAGQGAQIEGQVGYGPANSDAASAAGWTWADAAYGKDDGHNDEYQAELSPPVGSYAYAYRFRYKAGDWTLCDLDGSANGHDKTQQGSLQVVAVKPPEVDWCTLQWPASATVVAGEKLEIYGQVYVAGATEAAGAGAGIEGQVGYGPAGTDGSTDAAWIWSGTAFNKDEGNNDEYKGDLTLGEGSHAYAYRFRLSGGPWRYCDLDGSSGAAGFDPAQQGVATVKAAPTPKVGYCALESPASGSLVAGSSLTAYGEVYQAGVTEPAGQGAGIVGELGYGPAGTDGSTDASWIWSAATFDSDVSNNDKYRGSLSPKVGTWAYAYRFRSQGGDWTYCDLDGNTNGYAVAQQGALSVSAQASVWTQLRPFSPVENMGASVFVSAEVFKQGVTESPGQGAGITAQIGLGPVGVDPSGTGWSWTAAGYVGDATGDGAGANDVYGGWLVAPHHASTYQITVRFTVAGTDHYADGNGATPWNPAEAGKLSVYQEKDPPANDIGWCKLQWPTALGLAPGASEVIYGQVYVAGVTEPAGWGSQVSGEVGVGRAGSDPRTAQWTWFAAGYNKDLGNNDEHMATLVAPSVPGSYAYAYRFRTSTGWTYCDTDGAEGKSTFDPANAGALNVQ